MTCSTKTKSAQQKTMDASIQREDQNGLSSVANIRKKREQRTRDLSEQARRQKQAEEGKKRTRTVVEVLPYSPLFQSYRDQ
jgi:hypothetical protein